MKICDGVLIVLSSHWLSSLARLFLQFSSRERSEGVKLALNQILSTIVALHTSMLFRNHLLRHHHPSYPPKGDHPFLLVLHSCSNLLLHLRNLDGPMKFCYPPNLHEGNCIRIYIYICLSLLILLHYTSLTLCFKLFKFVIFI